LLGMFETKLTPEGITSQKDDVQNK